MSVAMERHSLKPETNRLVAFFALSYALSWAWMIPLVAAGQTVVPGRGWPTHFPSVLGPLLAAFLVTGRSGIRDLVARMARWRIGWRWWLVALSPLAFLGVALGVVAASGEPMPRFSDFARFSGMPSSAGVVGVAVLIIGVGGFGEEVGWRGYALPRLQKRFSPLTSTLILTACWAGWHVPQFFVIESYRNFSLGIGIGFVLGLACGAVIATWLYNRTRGSIWHSPCGTALTTSRQGPKPRPHTRQRSLRSSARSSWSRPACSSCWSFDRRTRENDRSWLVSIRWRRELRYGDV